MRLGQFAAAGQARHAFQSQGDIETRSLPNLLVATLATLPSMSLIPSAPFAHLLLSFCHSRPRNRRRSACPTNSFVGSIMHHNQLAMQQTRGVTRESSARARSPTRTGITSPESDVRVSDQLAAAALARARWLQATRNAFISARSTTIRVATPLYFFVTPVTVRLTAPWLTRP